MTLINNCPSVSPQILSNPFANAVYEYALYHTPMEISYPLASIGNIQEDHICGKPAIRFITTAGSIVIDDIFNPDYNGEKLVIGYSEDPTKRANYYLRFRYFNSLNE
jgi:hypothetical protein